VTAPNLNLNGGRFLAVAAAVPVTGRHRAAPVKHGNQLSLGNGSVRINHSWSARYRVES
jgi:hypothetical protein